MKAGKLLTLLRDPGKVKVYLIICFHFVFFKKLKEQKVRKNKFRIPKKLRFGKLRGRVQGVFGLKIKKRFNLSMVVKEKVIDVSVFDSSASKC